ncbi:hypothetical protein ACIBJD_19035 [Kitasatospora sp. NPDC050467]|uniref:hypothetical protein n=1 Tax=Kitasatospora sp. NPDC050467 TaxID=3364053 RepID=UPI0037BAADC0
MTTPDSPRNHLAGHPARTLTTYLVRPDRAHRAREAVARHWPALRAHGLVPAEPAVTYGAAGDSGPVLYELVTWTDRDAPRRAAEVAEVRAVRRELTALTEARAGRPAVEQAPVQRMAYFEDEPDLPTPHAYTGRAHYLVPPEQVADFHGLMRRDWPVLRAERLTTGDRAVVYYGEDDTGPFFLEVVRWYRREGPGIAYRNERVGAVWQEVYRRTEPRGARPACEYLWAAELKFPYHEVS